MLLDLHVHSSISPCSTLSLDHIVTHARAHGLDGVCITDHDSMASRLLLREGMQDNGLLVLVGMEYTTAQGDFLLFGPFEDLAPGLCARELLTLVHDAGGAAVAAHPCRSNRPTAMELAAQGLVHAVETLNGRNSEEENRLAQAWPGRFKLSAVGGSDAHTLPELGRSPTRFFTRIKSRADLVRALRKGRCEPALRQGRLPLIRRALAAKPPRTACPSHP